MSGLAISWRNRWELTPQLFTPAITSTRLAWSGVSGAAEPVPDRG